MASRDIAKALARRHGVPAEEWERVVAETVRESRRKTLDALAPSAPVSLSQGSRLYGVPVSTIALWADEGRIRDYGRLENSAGRPRYVDSGDLEREAALPRKPGPRTGARRLEPQLA